MNPKIKSNIYAGFFIISAINNLFMSIIFAMFLSLILIHFSFKSLVLIDLYKNAINIPPSISYYFSHIKI